MNISDYLQSIKEDVITLANPTTYKNYELTKIGLERLKLVKTSEYENRTQEELHNFMLAMSEKLERDYAVYNIISKAIIQFTSITNHTVSDNTFICQIMSDDMFDEFIMKLNADLFGEMEYTTISVIYNVFTIREWLVFTLMNNF